MSKVEYLVHIEPLPKGGFYISVPALPECQTTAKSFDWGLKKAKNLIATRLKALTQHHGLIPTESQVVRPLCVPIQVVLPRGARTVLASQLNGSR